MAKKKRQSATDYIIRDDEDNIRRKGQQLGHLAMKLHLVSGNLPTAAAAADAAAPPGGCSTIMKRKVWRRLPDELILEVLRFVPVAQQFQLQSLSRKWRQLLTSADFRRRSRASRDRRRQQRVFAHRAVACVTRYNNELDVVDMNVSSRSTLKVVAMDLFSFVPESFWSKTYKPTYSVVAAANGLVCISNDRERNGQEGMEWFERSDWETCELGWHRKPAYDKYCVLNPVTRTCKVLPRIPFERVLWLPPTPIALTVLGYVWDEEHKHEWDESDVDDRKSGWGGQVQVATYDLTASGSGRWEVVAAYKSDEKRWRDPPAALCSGETFVFESSWLHVLAPGPGGGRLVEVANLTEPSLLAMLGVDASRYADAYAHEYLVAHRGSVKVLRMRYAVDAVMGVWRLARKQLEWEAVARLDLAELERLTGSNNLDACSMYWSNVCAVREFLCFHVDVGRWSGKRRQFFLGFNLDTGGWEMVSHKAMRSSNVSGPFELRPDLFL